MLTRWLLGRQRPGRVSSNRRAFLGAGLFEDGFTPLSGPEHRGCSLTIPALEPAFALSGQYHWLSTSEPVNFYTWEPKWNIANSFHLGPRRPEYQSKKARKNLCHWSTGIGKKIQIHLTHLSLLVQGHVGSIWMRANRGDGMVPCLGFGARLEEKSWVIMSKLNRGWGVTLCL